MNIIMQIINNKAGKKYHKNLTTITDSSTLQMFYQELKKYQQILRVSEIPLDIAYVENTQPFEQLKAGSTPMLFTFQKGVSISAKRSDYIKMFFDNFYNISIIPCGNGVEIYRFETYQTGKGIGSYLMIIFNEISLRLEIPLYLIPGEVGVGETFRGDADAKRRRDFYHRHGFRRMNTKSLYWKNNEAGQIERIDICLNSEHSSVSTELSITKQTAPAELLNDPLSDCDFLDKISDLADDLIEIIYGEKYDRLLYKEDKTNLHTEIRQDIFNFIHDL